VIYRKNSILKVDTYEANKNQHDYTLWLA